MQAVFFKTQPELRNWFISNHHSAKELVIGYYKKATGKQSISWEQSVDEALCFGWIDGIRRSIDETSYAIRFTPRKPTSIWSDKNIQKVESLLRQGLMHPPGIAAYNKREEKRSRVYSFEQQNVRLADNHEATFKKNEKAWKFFISQAPSYQKAAVHWVESAKQATTRQKRLETLISDSKAHLKIKLLRR